MRPTTPGWLYLRYLHHEEVPHRTSAALAALLWPRFQRRIRPRPATREDEVADRLVHELAAEHAPRHGLSRREFLKTPAGMAAALFVVNHVTGCKGYGVQQEHIKDSQAARTLLSGSEFVVDCQTRQDRL